MSAIPDAVAAIRAGHVVIYPTETVYGLGAAATNDEAVNRVFAVKQRAADKPLSVAVASTDRISEVADPSDRSRRFMHTFLPGPVTVVVERNPALPDVVTAGGSRVGVRIPDHPVARSLLRDTPPLTATSANTSGAPSARTITDIDARVRNAVAVIIDDGETPGGHSTVVDVDAGIIHRRGAQADAIAAWLDEHQADSP